jgi:hypothetical protein
MCQQVAHPCQKQPSKNTATCSFGNNMSGRPGRSGCSFQPLIFILTSNIRKRSSVLLLPFPLMALMRRDRAGVTSLNCDSHNAVFRTDRINHHLQISRKSRKRSTSIENSRLKSALSAPLLANPGSTSSAPFMTLIFTQPTTSSRHSIGSA